MELQRPVQNSWYIKKMDFGEIKSRFLKKQLKPLTVPLEIRKMCTGINFNGIFIKSILFSTDMAIIENSDADAILAVYPFVPSFHIIKNITIIRLNYIHNQILS